MTMNITLPNGTVIKGIPDGTSKLDIARKAVGAGMATPEELGFTTEQLGGDATSWTDVAKENGRVLATSALKVADVIPEVGNSILSAGAWAGNKLGIGDGTYTPAAKVSSLVEPDWMKPQTEWGRTGAEVGSFLLSAPDAPLVAGRAFTRGAGAIADKLGSKASLLDADVIRKRANETARAVFGQNEKTQALADLVQPNSDIIEAAQRLGYDANDLLPHQYSDNPAMRDFMGVMASRPGSMLESGKALTGKLDNTVQDFVENYGGKLDPSELSMEFAGEMDKAVKGYDELARQGYSEIAAKIPPRASVDAPKTLDYINNRADDLGGLDKLNTLEKKVSNEFQPGEPRTYRRFDELRQEIGDKAASALAKGEAGEYQKLINLYHVMNDDLHTIASHYGLGHTLDKAKANYASARQTEEIQKAAMGRNLKNDLVPSVKVALKGLAKGDVSKFNSLMKIVPDEYQESAVMSAIGQMFRDGARSKTDLHIPGFVDWMREVKRNKEAYKALTHYMPPAAVTRLDDMYTMFSGIRRGMLSEVANTGGRIAQNDKLLDQAAGLRSFAVNHPVLVSGFSSLAPVVSTATLGPAAGIATSMGTRAIKAMGEGTADKLDKVVLSPEFTKMALSPQVRDLTEAVLGGEVAKVVKEGKQQELAKKLGRVVLTAIANEEASKDDEFRILITEGVSGPDPNKEK